MGHLLAILGLAALMIVGAGVCALLGVAMVHVVTRFWLMLSAGLDWDDAGTLIAARGRKRHGLGALPGISAAVERFERVMGTPLHVRPGDRIELTAVIPRPDVTGRPPWEQEGRPPWEGDPDGPDSGWLDRDY